jgi:enterochelin esterase family protein
VEAAQDRGAEVERFLQVLRAVGSPMIDGSAVTFVYYDPQARRVSVAGEFNQWSRGGDRAIMEQIDESGLFHYTLNLTEPARLEYKFIVDGEWKLDPLCPNTVDNGIGGRNSYFVVGDFHEPPELEPVEAIPHGRVEEFEFTSEQLGNRRTVYVYLPPAYEANSTRLPALYVHDGGEYLNRARLPVVLDNLIHAGAMAPLAAVMVDPVDRMTEYMMNEGYANLVYSELLPYIDGRFRTLANAEGRGVMGASLGGLISVHLALERPDLFSRIGSQSGAFFMADDRVLAMARGATAEQSFYFDVGKYEQRFIPAHFDLVDALEACGCRCFFQELAGGHNWTSWRAHPVRWRSASAFYSGGARGAPAPHRSGSCRAYELANSCVGRWRWSLDEPHSVPHQRSAMPGFLHRHRPPRFHPPPAFSGHGAAAPPITVLPVGLWDGRAR